MQAAKVGAVAGVAGTGIAAGSAWLTWQRLARRALPKTEGTLTVPGLGAEVTVRRGDAVVAGRPQRLAPARLCPIRYPPRFGERKGMGRARSGHPIRTAILSYVEHGRSRAIAQERTHPPFCRGKKGRKRRSSLWRRPLRLSSSAMSYGVSGPRVVNKRKQSRVRGILD